MEDKICKLRDAIRKLVKPGMTIHFSYLHTPPYAAIYEIIREFHGKNPGFKVVCSACGTWIQLLVASQLVEKLICAFAGDGFPYPSPSPVIQRAYKKGLIIECWSTLTMRQMLMAGALRYDWIPTNSILGSSMEEENRDSFFTLDIGGKKIGMVRGIKPDLSIRHVWCCDVHGNAVVTKPDGEGLWGQYASENVLITCEKIAPTSFIRKLSEYQRIPGYLVSAVSQIPYGGHPGALFMDGEGYAEDLDFILAYREAARDERKLESWMKEWILDVEHEGYLSKIGPSRLAYLSGKLSQDSWKDVARETDVEKDVTPTEEMICIGSRKIVRIVRERGYRTVLAGIGASNLAAWLASSRMDAELIAENGYYGYSPRKGSPYIFNLLNRDTCKAISDGMMILGSTLYGSLAVLGAVQVDKRGNINSTKIGDDFLLGSGGANDATSNASEVMVFVQQDRNRLVEKVPYITGRGERVKTLVTTSGVFEKIGDELCLVSLFPNRSVEEIKRNTGWKLKVMLKGKESPPTREELLALRYFDPDGYFR